MYPYMNPQLGGYPWPNYPMGAMNSFMLNGSQPWQGQATLSQLANPQRSSSTPVRPSVPPTPPPTPTVGTLSARAPERPQAPPTFTRVSPAVTAPAPAPPTPTPAPTPAVGPGSAALPSNMGYITQAPTGVPNSGVPFSPINTTGDLYASTLNEQWATPFTPPTAADVEATPGYQFMLGQGEKAIQQSAAAQGNLLTGGVAKDLNNYAQNFADQYYQQAYNNLLNQYQMNYNIFNQNQSNLFNRLSAITGTGQASTSQLANAGANYANQAANTGMAGASNVSNALNNAAAATASGYIGGANALGSTAQSLGQLPLAYNAITQNQALTDALNNQAASQLALLSALGGA
jgi:hypothetical protein